MSVRLSGLGTAASATASATSALRRREAESSGVVYKVWTHDRVTWSDRTLEP